MAEDTSVPKRDHRLTTSHWQLSHINASVPLFATEFRISIFRHFFSRIAANLSLASCKWWRKPEFPAKTTA